MAFYMQNLKDTPRDTTKWLLDNNCRRLREKLLKEAALLGELSVYLSDEEIPMYDMSDVTDPNLV